MKSPAILLLCLALQPAGIAADVSSRALPRSSPEEQGISSAAILAFVEAADKQVNAMHSLMLVRHGHVVAEGWWTPYAAESRHLLHSLSKSFTSTAVGLAIAEGKFSLDHEVLKSFPDEAPAEPSAYLKAMRVRDLLSMSTGHQTEAAFSTNQTWVSTFLSHSVPHKPGAHFLYNTPATYMLSAIVQKTTGMTVLDYLRPRLFDPLGIEGPTWGASPQGITFGGFGLSIRTEDIARFGQLYLQKGKWGDRQLVPADWVASATARQVSNGSNPKSDWEQGYGFQFWRCRYGIFRGDGAFGQFCVVLPDHQAVIAITAGTRDMQAVLNLIWDKLLPALQTGPLPADREARQKLSARLANLALPPQEGLASPGSPAQVSGRRFAFPANDQKIESIALELGGAGGGVNLSMRANGIEHRVACGKGAWLKGRMAYASIPDQPVAVSGAWASEDTYVAKFCFFETPTTVTVTLKFSGDQLLCDSESNVGFGAAKRPQLTGRAQ